MRMGDDKLVMLYEDMYGDNNSSDDIEYKISQARKLIDKNLRGLMNYYKWQLKAIKENSNDMGAINEFLEFKRFVQINLNQFNTTSDPDDN